MNPVFECRNIIKIFGGLTAVNSASLHVNQGEILGLVGPNGSGKTTLINVISGQYQANGGEMFFAGERQPATEPTGASRHRSYLPHVLFRRSQ